MKPFFLLVFLLLAAGSVSSEADPRPEIELTLEDAIKRAVEVNPELREMDALIRAERARGKSLSSFPNPEAVARMESARFEGKTGENAEYLAGISQSLPIGGRLSAARELERRNVSQREQTASLRLMEVRRLVHGAFATALFSDDAARLQITQLQDAESALRIANARVKSGDALPEEVSRVESELLQSKVEVKRAKHFQDYARKALASSIGDSKLVSAAPKGNLDEVIGLSSIEEFVKELRARESLGEAEVSTQEARLKLAKRERIPDVNLELLYRRLEGSRENAFDVGLRVPIPVFGSGRQRVREASAELAAAEARLENTRIQTRLREHEVRAHLETALESVQLLRDEVRPRASDVLRVSTTRYQAGDISLSDFLQRRREWLSVQEKYLAAIRELLAALNELESH